jgi:hypothetical protein
VDMRLPIAFLFVLLGFLEWNLPIRARVVFLVTAACLLVIRIGVVSYAWQQTAIDAVEMMQSAESIDPGSRILVATGDGASSAPLWLIYLPCLMTIERSSLVSLTFSDPTQQIVNVKPPYRAMTGGSNCSRRLNNRRTRPVVEFIGAIGRRTMATFTL